MSKPIAWSYTALTAFETCPKQFYHTRVAKDVPNPPGEAALWGQRVHKALENRLRDKTPLPASVSGYEGLASKFDAAPGSVIVEKQICIDRNMQPTDWFNKSAWCRGVIDVGVLNGAKAAAWDWKGLAADTPIPTPEGWATMGELRVGDRVFSGKGVPCTVVAKSDVHNRPCYKLTFDDRTTVVCDDEHLWSMDGRVIDTASIAADPPHPRKSNRYNVLVAGPIETPDVALPVNPYVLGCWLGDGKHTSGEISKPDEDFWENIQREGYELGADTGDRCPTRTVLGLRGELRNAALLGDKHIPPVYLRASYRQRLALLQGLMDSDGSVNTVRQQAIFTTCDKRLSDGVVELLLTLGQRPLQSVTTQTGFGKTVTAYPISFKPLGGLQPFRLRRKADKVLPGWGEGLSWRRRLSKIEPVDSVPTQCIAVDSEDNTYLCTTKFLTTHNTGKRKPENEQLELFAGLMFIQYPEVEVVYTGFIWLQDKLMDKQVFSRKQTYDIWGKFMPRVQRLENAHEAGSWPAKPSGLCRGWCPVKTCEHWKPKRGT